MNATASISSSRFGTPTPQITVSGTAHHTVIRAEVLRIAALVELATANEVWPVVVEDAYLYIELTHGTQAEANRALRMLKSVLA